MQPRQTHDHRRDSPSAWLGNLIFLLGALFGMGVMWLVTDLIPPDEDPDLAHFREVREFLLDTHVSELDGERLVEDAIDGMFAGLSEEPGDAYSQYYHDEETARVDRDTTGHFLGIGVVFRGGAAQRQVLFPVEDGPADRAGLRVGDVLLAIDGHSLEGLAAAEAHAFLRGELGQTLDIEVEGLDGQRRHHEVVLEGLTDPSIRHVELIDPEHGVGYLALLGFSNETARQFDAAVAELQRRGMRGLVLDLRGNRGGVLSSAVEVARRFLPEGSVTSTEGRGLPEVIPSRPESARYAGLPLVVLVDGLTASASEVVAGALQDHRAAVLVGEPTFGKGMVQTIRRYPERNAIAKATSSFYYTPAHRNLEAHFGQGSGVGLVPDVVVEVQPADRARLEEFLHGTFSPPPGALDALKAWELESGLELLPRRPRDRQLEAALVLFEGRSPLALAETEAQR